MPPMVDYAEALARIGAAATACGEEDCPVDAAHGRVLARDLVAAHDAPYAATSAMDGYALRSGDVAAGVRVFRCVGEQAAGGVAPVSPQPGECVRIFTGAPLPPACDRVIIQEDVIAEGTVVTLKEPVDSLPHVRAAGSDFRRGDVLLPQGVVLHPRALVTAAAANVAALPVIRRPRIALIATGDELATPGAADIAQGQIAESVSVGVAAMAAQWGAEVMARERVRDQLPLLEAAAARALRSGADLIITTGGASVGAHDHAKAMFAPMGLDLIFSRVAIKPGKPVWFGRLPDTAGAPGPYVLGLPGNPTSAMVTARLLMTPLLAAMSGRTPGSVLVWRDARLGADLPANGARQLFTRARLADGAAWPVRNQDSSAQRMLAAADVLIAQDPHSPAIPAGALVRMLDF